MESQFPVARRDELWRLQEDIKDLFATQGQHSERIMRLEKRRDEDTRVKNVWGPVSPFPGSGSFGTGTQQGTYQATIYRSLSVVLTRQQKLVLIPQLRRLEILTLMRSLA
jgi:hypothetical protein